MTINEAMANANFEHPYSLVAEHSISSETASDTVTLDVGTDSILVEDVIITGRDAAGVRLDDNQAAMELFTIEITADKRNFQGETPPDIDCFNKTSLGRSVRRFIMAKMSEIKTKITAQGTSGAAVLTFPVTIYVHFKGYIIKEG